MRAATGIPSINVTNYKRMEFLLIYKKQMRERERETESVCSFSLIFFYTSGKKKPPKDKTREGIRTYPRGYMPFLLLTSSTKTMEFISKA